DMVYPKVIKKVLIIGNVEDNQVGLLADFQRPQTIGPAYGGGSVERQGSDYFGGKHAHLRTSHGADEGRVLRRGGAWVSIRCQGHRKTALDQLASRRIRQAQEKRCTRKQGCNRTGFG